MADEENEELTELSPMDRARRVAGKVMQYIRDEANKPYTGYGGTIGLRPEEARMAADLVDNTAEAREFIESPGLGTAAMAGLGLTGFPAKEIAKGIKGIKKLGPRNVPLDHDDYDDLYQMLEDAGFQYHDQTSAIPRSGIGNYFKDNADGSISIFTQVGGPSASGKQKYSKKTLKDGFTFRDLLPFLGY